jgi:hypothetical protein
MKNSAQIVDKKIKVMKLLSRVLSMKYLMAYSILMLSFGEQLFRF